MSEQDFRNSLNSKSISELFTQLKEELKAGAQAQNSKVQAQSVAPGSAPSPGAPPASQAPTAPASTPAKLAPAPVAPQPAPASPLLEPTPALQVTQPPNTYLANIKLPTNSLVFSIKSSPGSKLCAIVTFQNRNFYVLLYNFENKKIVAKLEHLKKITCISFDLTGNFLATGCEDGKVRIWNLVKCQGNFRQIFSTNNCENTIDINENNQINTFPIQSLSYNSDGKYLAIGSIQKAYIFVVNNDKKQWVVNDSYSIEQGNIITCISFISNNMLAIGLNHGEITLLSYTYNNNKFKYTVKSTFKTNKNLPILFIKSINGEKLICTDQSNIYIFNTESKTPEKTIPGNFLALSPNKDHIYYKNNDQYMFYNINSQEGKQCYVINIKADYADFVNYQIIAYTHSDKQFIIANPIIENGECNNNSVLNPQERETAQTSIQLGTTVAEGLAKKVANIVNSPQSSALQTNLSAPSQGSPVSASQGTQAKVTSGITGTTGNSGTTGNPAITGNPATTAITAITGNPGPQGTQANQANLGITASSASQGITGNPSQEHVPVNQEISASQGTLVTSVTQGTPVSPVLPGTVQGYPLYPQPQKIPAPENSSPPILNMNPGSSQKDIDKLNMLLESLKTGELEKFRVLLEDKQKKTHGILKNIFDNLTTNINKINNPNAQKGGALDAVTQASNERAKTKKYIKTIDQLSSLLQENFNLNKRFFLEDNKQLIREFLKIKERIEAQNSSGISSTGEMNKLISLIEKTGNPTLLQTVKGTKDTIISNLKTQLVNVNDPKQKDAILNQIAAYDFASRSSEQLLQKLTEVNNAFDAKIKEISDLNDTFHQTLKTNLDSNISTSDILDPEYIKKIETAKKEFREDADQKNAKLKSLYYLNYSIMDLTMDSQFYVLYVIKGLRILFAYVSLFLATRIFTPMYEAAVYDKQQNPPALQWYTMIYLSLDAAFNVFLFVLLYLIRALFSTTGDFVIDSYLFKKYITDYLISTFLLMAISNLIAVVITKKKYFRYQYEGSRTIRAFEQIMFFTAIILYVFPFFWVL